MILISVTRHEPYPSALPPIEPRRLTVMQALELLCIGEIGWGAGVTACAPTRLQTTSHGHGVRTQVLFEGDETSMARLVLAAMAVRDRSLALLDQTTRDYAGYQTVDGMAGAFGLVCTGLMQEKIGGELAQVALLAASSLADQKDKAAAASLGHRCFFVALELVEDGLTFAEACSQVQSLRENAMEALKSCYVDSKRESAYGYVGRCPEQSDADRCLLSAAHDARVANANLVRFIEARIAVVRYGLKASDVTALLVQVESGTSFEETGRTLRQKYKEEQRARAVQAAYEKSWRGQFSQFVAKVLRPISACMSLLPRV